jgi:hypothetical protein
MLGLATTAPLCRLVRNLQIKSPPNGLGDPLAPF